MASLYALSSARILRSVPLPKPCTRRSANARPALQTVSEHLYFPDIVSRIL